MGTIIQSLDSEVMNANTYLLDRSLGPRMFSIDTLEIISY